MQQRLLNEMYEIWMRDQVSAALAELQITSSAQPTTTNVQTPAPSTDLPAADALQPSSDQESPVQPKRNRLKSFFGLG